jgi:hypothetical protein
MFKSALHKGTLLTVLSRLFGCGGFLPAAASAQFKAWVMAKLPDRPGVWESIHME